MHDVDSVIPLKEVDHLAKLAHLGLSQEELKKLQKDLEEFLDYAERLQEVEVSGIQPIGHITGLENVEREDMEAEKLASADEVLKGVPEKEGRWVKVPLIIFKSKVKS